MLILDGRQVGPRHGNSRLSAEINPKSNLAPSSSTSTFFADVRLLLLLMLTYVYLNSIDKVPRLCFPFPPLLTAQSWKGQKNKERCNVTGGRGKSVLAAAIGDCCPFFVLNRERCRKIKLRKRTSVSRI